MRLFRTKRSRLIGLLLSSLAGAALTGAANAQTEYFTSTPNAAISGHNNKSLEDVSALECMRACINERGFKCVSFDYNKNEMKCDLSDKRATDVGGLKTDYPGNPYDHYALKDVIEQQTSTPRGDSNLPPSLGWSTPTPNIVASVSAISGPESAVINTSLRGFVDKYGEGVHIGDHVQGMTMTASGRVVLSISRQLTGLNGCGGVLAYSNVYNPATDNDLTWTFYCSGLDAHPSALQASGDVVAVGSSPGISFFHLPPRGEITRLSHLDLAGASTSIGFTYNPADRRYYTINAAGSTTPVARPATVCRSLPNVSLFDSSTQIDAGGCRSMTIYASGQGTNLIAQSNGSLYVVSAFSTDDFWPDEDRTSSEIEKAANYSVTCADDGFISLFKSGERTPYEDVVVLTKVDFDAGQATVIKNVDAGRTQSVQTCVHDRPAFRFGGGVVTLKNQETYAFWSGRFLTPLPVARLFEDQKVGLNNDSFEFAIQRLPATSSPERNYSVGIDCQVDDISNEGTSGTITATFYDKTGMQIGTGSVSDIADGLLGCARIRDIEIAAKTRGDAETVKISTNSSDAFMVDQIKLYREGELVRTYGANNDKGWCLSTEASDGNVNWKYAADGVCVDWHMWSYSGQSIPNLPYDLAKARLGTTNTPSVRYRFDIQCDITGVENEGTTSKLTAIMYDANGREIGRGSHKKDTNNFVGNCTDIEFEVITTGKASKYRIMTDGSDAALLDQIYLYENGKEVDVEGVKNKSGWCLSTEESDAHGNWQGFTHLDTCRPYWDFDL